MKPVLQKWLPTWPPKEQMLSMCDWGNCSADPVVARYHKRPFKKDSEWLPVCSNCAKKEGG